MNFWYFEKKKKTKVYIDVYKLVKFSKEILLGENDLFYQLFRLQASDHFLPSQ